MDYCRLCAILKSSDDFKCKIDDRKLDIERKLVVCCNWNSVEINSDLPKNICISCFLQLELCSHFREVVQRAQQKLKQQLVKNNAQHSFDETLGMPIKLENDDIEPMGIGFEDSNPFPENLVHVITNEYDSDGNHQNKNDQFSEESSLLGITAVRMKNQSNRKKPSKISKKLNKSSVRKMLNFNMKSLFSGKDINKDGTIKPEILIDNNIHNWSIVENRCYECHENFQSHSCLWEHFSTFHSQKKFRLMCPICPKLKKFEFRSSYRRHISEFHHPYLAFW